MRFILLALFRALAWCQRLCIFLGLNLDQAARALFQNEFLFLSDLRIRINTWLQVAIPLHQARGHRTKCYVPLEAVKDGLVAQREIFHDLTVVGGFLRYPALQFHKNARVPHQYFFQLVRRGRHAA